MFFRDASFVFCNVIRYLPKELEVVVAVVVVPNPKVDWPVVVVPKPKPPRPPSVAFVVAGAPKFRPGHIKSLLSVIKENN